MNKIIIIVILFHGLLDYSKAQTITWQRTYGDGYPDFGYSIVQTPDEGFIAVGRKSNGTDSTIIALRLDKFGNVIWTRFYRGFYAHEIIKSNDGNYLIGGRPILKINIYGDTIWTRPQTSGYKFKLTKDGGFYLCAGKQVSQFLVNPYLRRFDSLGYLLWDKVYSNNIYDGKFSDMNINEDGTLTLIGNCSDSAFISDKPFIMKTDALGNQIWFQKSDSLRYLYIDFIYRHNDGGYIVSGITYFVKYNSVGQLEWIKYYRDNDTIETIQYLSKTNDGGFCATGCYHIFEGNEPYYVRLFKCDTDGNFQWRKFFGFNDADYGDYVNQTSDSGFIIIGYRAHYQNGDIYIIKTDKNGYANPPVYINSVFLNEPDKFRLFQNYPNPFNPTTNLEFGISKLGFVSLKVYDVLGKEIRTLVNEIKQPGIYKVEFDGSSLASGIYFYTIEAGSFKQTKLMLLLK